MWVAPATMACTRVKILRPGLEATDATTRRMVALHRASRPELAHHGGDEQQAGIGHQIRVIEGHARSRSIPRDTGFTESASFVGENYGVSNRNSPDRGHFPRMRSLRSGCQAVFRGDGPPTPLPYSECAVPGSNCAHRKRLFRHRARLRSKRRGGRFRGWTRRYRAFDESPPAREVWKHEAYDFSSWLTENLDVLNDHLEVPLVSADTEQAAGAFSVDLLAEDEGGKSVIIENQLERSNHDHLGKVITYLASFGAETAIWIVADPRPEHVAAVTWLNESSAASFYLFKVEAVRIGASAPAPLLTQIVGSERGNSGDRHHEEGAQRAILDPTTLLDRAPGSRAIRATSSIPDEAPRTVRTWAALPVFADSASTTA